MFKLLSNSKLVILWYILLSGLIPKSCYIYLEKQALKNFSLIYSYLSVFFRCYIINNFWKKRYLRPFFFYLLLYFASCWFVFWGVFCILVTFLKTKRVFFQSIVSQLISFIKIASTFSFSGYLPVAMQSLREWIKSAKTGAP